MVEVAIILPIMILLIAMAVDAVSGVFRFQQIATLAREGSRYMCVHAGQYAVDVNQPLTTADQLKNNILLPMSVSLQPSLLSCQITWLPSGDAFPYKTTETGSRKQNMVRVVVSYQWQPIFLLGTPLTLTSASESPISR